MQKAKIVLIGAGGHCKACIDVVEQTGKYSIAGILDQHVPPGTEVNGYPVIGGDYEIASLAASGHEFLITVGQIKSAVIRQEIAAQLEACRAKLATVIASGAYVSRHAEIGEGSIVMHGAFINAAVKIGKFCILNTACIIEHDVEIGAHCHISTMAAINGNCRIADGVFVGSNATISNQVSIVAGSIVGAGAVVVRDITVTGTYVGNPACLTANKD